MQSWHGVHSPGCCCFMFVQFIGVYHGVFPLFSCVICPSPKPSLLFMFCFSCGWSENSGGWQLFAASCMSGIISLCVMFSVGSMSIILGCLMCLAYTPGYSRAYDRNGVRNRLIVRFLPPVLIPFSAFFTHGGNAFVMYGVGWSSL